MRTLAILLVLMPVFRACAADPMMTAQERAHVIKLLDESRTEFLSYLESLNEAQWKWKASPERWSVGETAEHIVLTEGALFGKLKEAMNAPENPDWETQTARKTEFIERVMVDRSHKATAPEQVRPMGLTRAEVLRRFQQARDTTILFVRETAAPLKSHTAVHPFPVFNTLNAYQWLIYIPLHNLRHDQQIAEVKASAGYPK
jgi:hypothetical protein